MNRAREFLNEAVWLLKYGDVDGASNFVYAAMGEVAELEARLALLERTLPAGAVIVEARPERPARLLARWRR